MFGVAPGERTLKQMEVNKDFGQLLLHIIGAAGSDLHIRLAAAVALKNYVRKYWPVIWLMFLLNDAIN